MTAWTKYRWSLPHQWHMMADDEGGGGDGSGEAGTGADSGGDAGSDGAGSSDGDGTGTEGSAGYWPEDWQKRLAGDDEKAAKHLGRYAAPEDIYKALTAAQGKIRSGELKSALPENPSEEEVKAYREDRGIPLESKDYSLEFESGLVIGDEDKEMVGAYLEDAHGRNMSEADVKANLQFFYDHQERQLDAIAENDEAQKTVTEDELRDAWGADYRRNTNMVNNLIDAQAPEAVKDLFKNSRMPDGQAVFNSPDMMKFLVNLALIDNPVATLVPAGTGDPAKSIADEIASIEKGMRTNRKAYDKDKGLQARYVELIDAQLKQKKAS